MPSPGHARPEETVTAVDLLALPSSSPWSPQAGWWPSSTCGTPRLPPRRRLPHPSSASSRRRPPGQASPPARPFRSSSPPRSHPTARCRPSPPPWPGPGPSSRRGCSSTRRLGRWCRARPRRITVPGGPAGIIGSEGQHMAQTVTSAFTVAPGSVAPPAAAAGGARLPPAVLYPERTADVARRGGQCAARFVRLALAQPAGRAHLAVDRGHAERDHPRAQ